MSMTTKYSILNKMINPSASHRALQLSTNLLLTEREGRTGEYWPSVRLEQARLVSSLLYGTLSLIVKCTSGGLHLKMFVFSIYLWNFGKISIFLFSSDSFNVKNVIIHTFYFAVLVANFEFAGFAPKQKYRDWTVSMEMVRTAKSWPRKNQSEHRDLPKTGLAIW